MPINPNDLRLFLAVEDASAQQGIDPDVIHRMMKTESGGNATALSPKGAFGPMQLMEGTARDLGVDRMDPVQNINGGVKYYKQMLDRYQGNDQLARAAYNAGPGNVDKYKGVPPFAETQSYVQKTAAPPQSSQSGGIDLEDLRAYLQGGDAAASPTEFVAPQGKSLSGFGQNVMSSGADFLGGIGNAIMHPVDTVTNLGKLGIGAAEKILPEDVKQAVGDYTPMADAVGSHFKDRYGGMQNIADTAYSDPVGVAADLSTLLGIGSAALPGKVGRLAGVASEITNPLNAILKPASVIGGAAAEGLMGRALHPSLKLRQEFGDANKIARTALDEGINVSDKGLGKVDTLRAGLAVDKAGIETEAMNAGRKADPKAIYDQVRQLMNQKGVGVQMFPDEDIAAVQDVMSRWRDQNTTVTPHQMPNGQTANVRTWNPIQDLLGLEADKQGTYKSLNEAFRKMSDRPGRTQAEGQAAVGAKNALETATQGFTAKNGDDLAAVNQHDNRLRGVKSAAKDSLTQQGPNMGFDALLAVLGGNFSIPAILGHQILARPGLASPVARGIDWMSKLDNPTLGKFGVLQPNRALTAKTALLRALLEQQQD